MLNYRFIENTHQVCQHAFTRRVKETAALSVSVGRRGLKRKVGYYDGEDEVDKPEDVRMEG